MALTCTLGSPCRAPGHTLQSTPAPLCPSPGAFWYSDLQQHEKGRDTKGAGVHSGTGFPPPPGSQENQVVDLDGI